MLRAQMVPQKQTSLSIIRYSFTQNTPRSGAVSLLIWPNFTLPAFLIAVLSFKQGHLHQTLLVFICRLHLHELCQPPPKIIIISDSASTAVHRHGLTLI